MTGTVRLRDDRQPRPVRLVLTAHADEVLLPHRTTTARLTGRIHMAGHHRAGHPMAGGADGLEVTGTLEISPLARRRIHYRLEFTLGDDGGRSGERCTLEGWKSVTPRRPLASMTALPFTLTTGGEPVGHGAVRFSLATALIPFLASFRFPRREDSRPRRESPRQRPEDQRQHWAPRWKGQPGRTEVWYTTVTDPVTGAGLWLHHELTAPTDGSRPVAHGWAALFPADGPVEHARFGPAPWDAHTEGFAAAGVEALAGRLRGRAGPMAWDLTETPEGAPLYTFPSWSWRHPLLPAAQILPAATARYTGTVRHGDSELTLRDAPGASARIYGHGNARRWAWLHADLGGGNALEIVAAVSMRPGLDRLPPLVFLRLRKEGRTWPRGGLRTAVGRAGIGRFTARIALPTWTVTGRAGLRRIRVDVSQPESRTLALEYTDPDGSHAVCRNSETADARILLERWWGRWRTEAEWTLDATAHAEVGSR
ncbi:hypothetical protein ACIGXA_10310 [Streptomyces fildesensis]|uniref:Uncharacterized protein n=1 Tax=Streptomyces fildesensis TaxID=375757 RepID=A0ABW8C3A2_9ACTN